MADEIFGDLPVLETERLRLRKLTPDDAPDIFEYASDPEVTRYLIWSSHRTIDDCRDFITSAMDRYRKRGVAPWGIVHKADRKVIGTCDFITWWPAHARAEIGYALSRTYWGQGIMTEAVRAIIDFGFCVKELNRIQALCEVANVGSARVMEKVGMTFEGILRHYMIRGKAYRDMKMYSLLRHEWTARSGAA